VGVLWECALPTNSQVCWCCWAGNILTGRSNENTSY
jgi:hypothetical protein